MKCLWPGVVFDQVTSLTSNCKLYNCWNGAYIDRNRWKFVIYSVMIYFNFFHPFLSIYTPFQWLKSLLVKDVTWSKTTPGQRRHPVKDVSIVTISWDTVNSLCNTVQQIFKIWKKTGPDTFILMYFDLGNSKIALEIVW